MPCAPCCQTFCTLQLCNTANALPQSIGRSLDITSCLSARLVCSSWCDGVSSSIASLMLTPALLATLGPEPLKRCLSRLAHLENVDLALAGSAASGKQRVYSAAHVQQLLELLAQHCKQKKLPALLAFVELLPSRSSEPSPLSAALAAFNNAAAGDAAAGNGLRTSSSIWPAGSVRALVRAWRSSGRS
ncbi:hypothetical protein COO60DRAFT_178073 [Scenedesmus sp. NREL 46B-D3]|nr:hypothetical protein COO60DRAFT_178073 [Scenedesmus sp. NREL 46B-D3]